MRTTESGQPVETPEEIAHRFGTSIEFGREHQGRHVCVDGRWYLASCLVADPACEKVARAYLRDHERNR